MDDTWHILGRGMEKQECAVARRSGSYLQCVELREALEHIHIQLDKHIPSEIAATTNTRKA